jgi:DNA repair protein RadC
VSRILDEDPINLALHELLSALLEPGIGSSDAHQRAVRLLCAVPGSASLGPLRRLAGATADEILRSGGLTRSATARVLAALELGRRLAREGTARQDHVAGSQELAQRFTIRLRDLTQTEWWVVATSHWGEILAETLVARGNPPVPRDVLRAALRVGATRIALVHNDPIARGKPKPLRDDRELHVDIADAAALMNVPLWDHVVIGKTRYFSYAEAGILTTRPRRRKDCASEEPARLTTAADVADLFRNRFQTPGEVQWWMIAMGAGDEILEYVPMFDDGRVDARAVVQTALRLGASSIALVRNDPAARGKPRRSPIDQELSLQLTEAAAAVGLHLCGHVVVGAKSFTAYGDF